MLRPRDARAEALARQALKTEATLRVLARDNVRVIAGERVVSTKEWTLARWVLRAELERFRKLRRGAALTGLMSGDFNAARLPGGRYQLVIWPPERQHRETPLIAGYSIAGRRATRDYGAIGAGVAEAMTRLDRHCIGKSWHQLRRTIAIVRAVNAVLRRIVLWRHTELVAKGVAPRQKAHLEELL